MRMSRKIGDLFCIGTICAVLSAATSSVVMASEARAPTPPRTYERAEKIILVGVRERAEPFAYTKASRRSYDILDGYGGYMVEVCRTVLRQMVGSGYFEGYEIKPVQVTAENRFRKLAAREIDLMCGPDSITTERLQLYNISHPIFLSGIAIASLPDHRMPEGIYCGPLVGMVGGTTAQLAGLKAVLEARLFRRFNEPMQRYLDLQRGRPNRTVGESLADRFRDFRNKIKPENTAELYEHGGINAETPALVKTRECPDGFKEGPVIKYKEHDAGLTDLCNGRIFFYLGDVDIVKRKLPLSGCDASLSRRTFTREAYGVYFRRVPSHDKASVTEAERTDAVLYSEFNNMLFSQMQNSENVLADQYASEFGDAEMAGDLAEFFRSFQYATNY